MLTISPTKNDFMKLFKLLITTLILGNYSFLALANDKNKFCQEGSDTCTFVLLSEVSKVTGDKKSTISSINKKRANFPLSPFSTFKVANSLIGLDLGVIKNIKQKLTFDKNLYPEKAWWPPVWKLPHYDLTTAFKYSMVAIYRQLANDIGEKNMNTYLNKMQYGNEDISSGLDSFWLNGSMKISAVEQVSLLQKIYHNQFSFQQSSIEALKDVMLVDAQTNYRIYAKTGAGKVDDGSMLGWYIGYVENSSGVHFFAFNFNSPTYAQMKANRISMAMNHLKLAGIIE
jgi:beta-lactamase class D